MNDDYLWDRSGKPDPEIQQLEEILGTLRYQPRELVIPQVVQTATKSFFYRGLAIAAAIGLVVIALGIWMAINKQKTSDAIKTETKPAPLDSNRASAGPDERKLSNLASAPAVSDQPPENGRTNTSRHPASAGLRSRNRQPRRPQLSESEIAEAIAAKEQLMIALRLASTKLSLAQKKTQGTSTENEIHNQHKAG